MSRILLLSAVFLLPCFLIIESNAQPTVSASIKPLQLIAAAITADAEFAEEPGLIIGPAQDPHHPFLRPSERHTLYEADVLLWIGPQLEAALADIIDSNAPSVINVYELIEEAGLTIEVEGGIADPHVWLASRNSRLIAAALSQKLIELDPAQGPLYEENLRQFQSTMDALDSEINSALQGLKGQPFAVYHNAFSYYEKQYGLMHTASFTENEELQPGIRKVMQIRESLEANDVFCLLLEPSNNPDEIRQLTGRDMNLVSIDILGFDYAVNKTAYRDFMRGITQAIKQCLQR